MSSENTPATGDRVVLGRRENSMVRFRWSGHEPDGFNDVDAAQELGAAWEGDELVVYDLPGFIELLAYYENNEYLSDND